MNMYGWTTWGRIDTDDLSDYYRGMGPFQLFKHWTGPIIAVPESIERSDAFLMLAHMNDHLEAVHKVEREHNEAATAHVQDYPIETAPY